MILFFEVVMSFIILFFINVIVVRVFMWQDNKQSNKMSVNQFGEFIDLDEKEHNYFS